MALVWKKFVDIGGIRHSRCKKAAKDQIALFSTKTTGLKQKMRELSGGNQQKVLLSRWLLAEPEILILDEPTRGIDVGAKYDIYKEMIRLVKAGKCIIMISSEMPEVLGMSDRIAVAVSYTHLDVYKRQGRSGPHSPGGRTHRSSPWFWRFPEIR